VAPGLDWRRTGPRERDVDYHAPFGRGPIAAGFDSFFGISGSLDMDPYVYIENERLAAPPTTSSRPAPQGLLARGADCPRFSHHTVLQTLTQRALDVIDQRAGAGSPSSSTFRCPRRTRPFCPRPVFAASQERTSTAISACRWTTWWGR